MLQLLLILVFCTSAGILYYHMVAVPEENRELAETLKDDFPGEHLPEETSGEGQPAGEKALCRLSWISQPYRNNTRM